MAKKKKKAAKKMTAGRAWKKTTAGKSATRKKASAKKKTVKTGRSAVRSKSVDSVLKKFKLERSSLEAQLKSVRKKIDDLEAKADRLQQQISNSRDSELKITHKIDQLDARRDGEVSAVLAELGIQLGAGISPPTFGSTAQAQSESVKEMSRPKDTADREKLM